MSHPFLSAGFRPFFLLAGLMGAAWVPLWTLAMLGHVQLPIGVFGIEWHGHEMIFGFVTAVIAGFLLTAARNWTGRPTLDGFPLLALALLWLAGRIAIFFASMLPPWLPAVVDIAFLPILAGALAIPLWQAKNWRNIGFIPLLALLTAANVLFHATAGTEWAARAVTLGMNVIVLIMIVVGGRVIPFFTGNALRPLTTHRFPVLDWAAFGFTALVLLLQFTAAWNLALGVAALFAAFFNAARMVGWQSRHTWNRPIVWVLHVGYAFIPIGLLMRGLEVLTPFALGSLSTHALTVGAMGLLILGMMSRVSLGHTGRPLQAPLSIAVAYGLLLAAAVVRALVPAFTHGWYLHSLVVSTVLWSLAFAVYVVVFAGILFAPRLDGKPG